MPLTQFDAALELGLDLSRLDASTRAELIQILRKLEKDLISEIATGQYDSISRAKVAKQLKDVEAAIQSYYEQLATISLEASNGAVQVSVTATARALESATTLTAALPSQSFIRELAGNAIIQGATQAAWWRRQSADIAWRFAQALRQGLANSEANGPIIARVRDLMGIGRANAAALVQTSVQTVANNARMATFKENSDLIASYQWTSALDSHVCPLCAARADLSWTVDDEPIGHSIPFANPPIHFNCLTGDSLVSSVRDVTGTSKRWFDGKIIIIKTAAGRELSCTPNHPILTGSGWVAAGSLNIGGNVICDSFSQRGAFGDSNHKDVPSSIHDFIESFLSSGKVISVPVPVSASDFHGDGIGSKVAVVYSESLLRNSLYPAPEKHSSKDGFMRRFSSAIVDFFGSCSSFKAREFCWSSSKRIMRRLGKGASLLWGVIRHSCKLLFASIPCGYPRFAECSNHNHSGMPHSFSDTRYTNPRIEQCDSLLHIDVNKPSGCVNASGIKPPDDSIEAYSKLARELLAGSAGCVSEDKIISIEVRNFSGHVYNLETVKGWYVANGIITHNCRCVMIPITKSWESLGIAGMPDKPVGTRASSDGQVPANMTFADFLNRKGVAWQDSVLGVGRAKLWREKSLSLNDLVNGNSMPLSLAELKAKYGQ